MKQRFLSVVFACLTLFFTPLAALAQDEEFKAYDARLEGYPTNVTLEGGSTALTWLLFIFLSVVCIGVMFKNPRRTHLD